LNKQELEERTKKFSLDVISFLQGLPKNYLGDVMGRQLLRSATSVGANYREANRAESRADFLHKISLAEKEAGETLYWLELIREAGMGASSRCDELLQEADELVALFTSIGKSTRRNTMLAKSKNL
jgi:four helix bundle protein